ncbi:MAG: VTT domain-containing protein [Acidobacteria bacterium]|nr:VTT domain-containing protein [Acidobacteriota bacterium]
MGSDSSRVPRRTLFRFVALVAIVVIGFAVLRFTPLSQYLTVEKISALFDRLRSTWWAPLALIATYVVLCPLGVPASPMMLTGGMVFGFIPGFLLNLLGTWLGGVTTYFLGRVLGRDFVAHLAGNRLKKVERAIARRGFWSLVAIRLLPIPYPLVNYCAALTGIPPGLFMVTTVLGLIPANLLFAYFASALVHLAGPERNKIYVQFGVVIALLVLLTVAPQVWMARKRKRRYLELREQRSQRSGKISVGLNP